MRYSPAFALLTFLSLTGCMSPQQISSGRIGCPESQIKISNEENGFGTKNWVAECRGRRFFCSGTATGKDSEMEYECREELGDSAAATESRPSAPAGCQYDAQCKGDRVCSNGKCVTP
jgi:hypothetical protein